MKKVFCLFAMIAMISFSSCESDPDVVMNDAGKASNIDFNEKGIVWPSNWFFSAEANFISASNGCYTVQVNIFLTTTGTGEDNTKTLVATGNAQIGDCPKSGGMGSDPCPDGEYRGDYFDSREGTEMCLYDLVQDKDIYPLYLAARDQAIADAGY